MANEQPIEASLLELIRCIVCLDEVEQLKVLCCQHTICLSCVEQLTRRQNRVNCPLCKKEQIIPNGGLYQLPTSLISKQIADLIRRRKLQPTSSTVVKDGESCMEPTKEQTEQRDEHSSNNTEPEPAEVLPAASEEGATGISETEIPPEDWRLTTLKQDIELAVESGKRWCDKAGKQLDQLNAAKKGIPEACEKTKNAITAYQQDVDRRCQEKLVELSLNERERRAELDTMIDNLRPGADKMQSAIQIAQGAVSKLSADHCLSGDVLEAQKQLAYLNGLNETIRHANHDVIETDLGTIRPGDAVRLQYTEDKQVEAFVKQRVKPGSVGTFIGIGVNASLTSAPQRQPLVIFPEKHNWIGPNLQSITKAFTKVERPFLGDRVQVKASVVNPHFTWKGATAKSRGILSAFDHNTAAPNGELVVNVDFPEERGWKGLYSEVELLPGCGFEVGDEVRVNSRIPEPSRGWGGVTASSVGKVKSTSGEKGMEEITVEFSECENWIGLPADLELTKKLVVGDKVQVKLTVDTPQFGWGGIDHNHVGIIQTLPSGSDLGQLAQVSFPGRSRPWSCKVEELEPVRYGSAEIQGINPNMFGEALRRSMAMFANAMS